MSVGCDVIRRVREYVIEVHGAYLPIVHRMRGCGYVAGLVRKLTNSDVPLTIWCFRQSRGN